MDILTITASLVGFYIVGYAFGFQFLAFKRFMDSAT